MHHIFDSMTLVGPLPSDLGKTGLCAFLMRVGPRLPAAVLASMRPDWSLTAVDAVAKKIAFIRQAATEAEITNSGWPACPAGRSCAFDASNIVVSRAFGSLDTFAAQTHHLLRVAAGDLG